MGDCSELIKVCLRMVREVVARIVVEDESSSWGKYFLAAAWPQGFATGAGYQQPQKRGLKYEAMERGSRYQGLWSGEERYV